jgi:hypothetical protein
MIVSSKLQELSDKLREHGYYSIAEEIDHVMLMGDLQSVETLIVLFEQFTKKKV